MLMDKKSCNPEIWGGIECTINRFRDQYFDQLQYAGHYERDTDIDQLAATGIRKLRYPILWEKHQPEPGCAIDWSRTESRLNRIREKGIGVIATLLHHGSGPKFTQLDDPAFPEALAAYARQVAAKFPWLTDYTPVNEPLTTARFSGLYGIWYPHSNSSGHFVRMLLNQLKGTVLAMREIRQVNPAARLVQTEDLGKTYSTPKLRYQARFENERRWLTYDILLGRLDDSHPLRKHFLSLGIPEKELDFFLEHPCPPDVFGFNHYLTSERFLDERLSRYPSHTHGGNGRHRYADVEAVRVELEEDTGLAPLLREAWERFGRPMAITEVHLHCHREEQLRWFREVWDTACTLRNEGVQLEAVTAWAMLGSFGWNRLLTVPNGDYEPGVFDLRGGMPRPTALARFIQGLASDGCGDQPLAAEKGWWQRHSRIVYGPVIKQIRMQNNDAAAPLLVIGKNGTLGRAFANLCEQRSIPYQLLSRQDCDISDAAAVEKLVRERRPWAVINAAGYVRVDDAEADADSCFAANTVGPHNLAQACAQYGLPLVSFSSDLVFDGGKDSPYVESDAVNPLNAYGRSKAESEKRVLEEHPGALLVRTSAFFGPWDEYNFIHYIRKSLQAGEAVRVATDMLISPTYVPDLVNATLDLLVDGEKGIWHLANQGAISWADLAYRAAEGFELDRGLIQPVPASEMGYVAARPRYSVLGSEKGHHLPTLEQALDRYLTEKGTSKRQVA